MRYEPIMNRFIAPASVYQNAHGNYTFFFFLAVVR